MKEINILGAGVSGLTAAINISKAGYPVKIYEARKDCGSRFSNDLQGLENWTSNIDALKQLRTMNIKIDFEYSPLKNIIFTNGSKKVFIESKKPLCYLVRRGTLDDTLDQSLKEQALENNVKIKFNSSTSPKWINIVATGPKKPLGIVSGVSFDTENEDLAVALLSKKSSFKGYSYLLIANGRGCICTVLTGRFGAAQTYLNKTISIVKKTFDIKTRNSRKAGGIGWFSLEKKFVDNGKMYVGEAAGLQDALAGFGIRSSMASGFLASKNLFKEKNYERVMNKTYSERFKASVVNRFFWDNIISENFDLFLEYFSRVKNPSKSLFNLYNFNYFMQRILYPISLIWFKRKYPQ